MAAVVLSAVLVPAVSAGKTHVYPVKLTISVERSAHKIKGTVSSEAPAQFCEESMIRLMKVEPGKDKKVNSVFPGMFGQWGMTISSRLSGSKVYAEVLRYHLPQRPVICEGAKSPIVTAP